MPDDDIPVVLENRVGLNARRLAKLLNENSMTGTNLDPQLTADQVIATLRINAEEAGEAAGELEDLGLVTLHKRSNMGSGSGFSLISARPELFIATDGVLKGWDTIEDARTLAAAVLDSGKTELLMEDVCKLVDWPPRRINPPTWYIRQHGLADCLEARGSYPYEFFAIRVNARTKRFASGTL